MEIKNNKIAVIGMGLIGGSISLALKKHFTIMGLDSDREALQYALDNNVIDEIGSEERLTEAGVVFVAVPLKAVKDTVKRVCDIVGSSALVTDVASVKGMLEDVNGRIVGGHPMAGTEKSGVRNAKNRLFENAYYVLVKYSNTSEEDYDTLTRLVKLMGAKPMHMSAQSHDRTVSYVSHMPHAVAYALISSVISKDTTIAGSGLMDTTRIASSSPDFWTEVFKLNRKNILDDLDSFIYEITHLRQLIDEQNESEIRAFLSSAKKTRDKIESFKFNRSSYTLHFEIADRVGELSKIISLLSDKGVNISNIGIISNREGVNGALKLTFDSELEYLKAEKILNSLVSPS